MGEEGSNPLKDSDLFDLVTLPILTLFDLAAGFKIWFLQLLFEIS